MNRLRKRFGIEENAMMSGYQIHADTPKVPEKRSVPYPDRLAPVIEQVCAGNGPAGLLFGGAFITCATRTTRDGSRTR